MSIPIDLWEIWFILKMVLIVKFCHFSESLSNYIIGGSMRFEIGQLRQGLLELAPSERNSSHCAHCLHKCLGQLRSNMPYLSMKLCYKPLNSFEQVELWSGAHKDFSIRKNLNVNFLMHEQALRHSAMNQFLVNIKSSAKK